MKKTILLTLTFFVLIAAKAQDPTPVIVKEHYTVSGGVLGALNLSEFRAPNDDENGIDYITKPGWAAGFWLNFPVAKAFSVEPQVLYSSHRYLTNNTSTLSLNDGRIRYLSVPLLLKFHLGDNFAITAGPQLDVVMAVKDNRALVGEDDFKQASFSGFAGLEVFPRGRISIFGRYIHGFTNMDNRSSEAGSIEYKNENIQAGLKFKLFGKKVPADSDGDGVSDPKDKCPNQYGYARYEGCPIPDTDGDGLNDEVDKCPGQAGTAKYNGCPIPDKDGDGINDEEDKCPDQKGTAKYGGCPIPDKDGDGINDEEDKCPDQAGPAERGGCPVTDRDNDGINDDDDKCPDVPGSKTNNGCPDVPANVSKTLGAASQGITFGTGAKLTTKSNASLNQLVTIMNENPGLKVRVEGHSDNAGNDDANMKLTQDRADAVKAYLVSKGISADRITAEGFGETQPIADNNSATGRTKNRRIEIRVVY